MTKIYLNAPSLRNPALREYDKLEDNTANGSPAQLNDGVNSGLIAATAQIRANTRQGAPELLS
jgi:hypothetical protein